jgi:orotidine-5'-phosphate decarboxylase
MNRQELIAQIKSKKSFLCVGLDSDIEKLPTGIEKSADGILEFNRQIIEATKAYCVSYKINTAFYESLGIDGWRVMAETIAMIPKEHLIIADAKRGDIGNTSTQYAKAFFESLHCDAVTVAPYMGSDSVKPFLAWQNKWTIVLALTSNAGAADFQFVQDENGVLHEQILKQVSTWGTLENLMFVVGATKAQELKRIRQIVPDHFLLIPGVGTQGGNLQEVYEYGSNADCGLLVNVSRAIIFADSGIDFAKVAEQEAKNYALQMAELLN